jgi:hypothetical protein
VERFSALGAHLHVDLNFAEYFHHGPFVPGCDGNGAGTMGRGGAYRLHRGDGFAHDHKLAMEETSAAPPMMRPAIRSAALNSDEINQLPRPWFQA